MRIITDAPRNVDVCIAAGMFLVQTHVDLPSTVGSEANVTLFRLVRRANHVDFACGTYKYPSINDITREDHGLVKGEVNVSGPEQGIPRYFTEALKLESFKTSQLKLLAEVWCQNEHAKLYFGLMKSAIDIKYLVDK